MLREKKMAVHRNVDPEAVDEHDPGVSLHERSGDFRRPDLHREKRRVPRGLRLAAFRDRETARTREIERVHEIDPLLAERLEQTLHRGRPERLRIELQDRAAVCERELGGPVIEELSRERAEALGKA